MVALLVLLTVLVFLTADYFVQRRRHARVSEGEAPVRIAPPIVRDPQYRTPFGVYFDRGHAWAFLRESGEALVGIDDLARTVMGPVDRFETAPIGSKVRQGDRLVELFHGDRSIVIESPLDGTVEGINDQSQTESEGFTANWVCRIQPSDTSLLQETMMLGEKAAEWIGREARRLRVFLSTIATEHPVLAETMHDGGMPYAGLAEYLDDENWNTLREKFFHQHNEADNH